MSERLYSMHVIGEDEYNFHIECQADQLRDLIDCIKTDQLVVDTNGEGILMPYAKIKVISISRKN